LVIARSKKSLADNWISQRPAAEDVPYKDLAAATTAIPPGFGLTGCAGQLGVCFLRGDTMAKLALVYGMRLFPADELGEVGEAGITLKDGRKARVTMHLIEGSKEQIEETLRQSMEAFFEMYPEI
jgi:hypothetical protein